MSYASEEYQSETISAAFSADDDYRLGGETYEITPSDLADLAEQKAKWVADGRLICPECLGRTALGNCDDGCDVCNEWGWVYPDGTARPRWEVGDDTDD